MSRDRSFNATKSKETSRDAPIIGSAIGNTLYNPQVFYISYRIGMCSKLLADLIEFLGGQVVARKPYLIQTLRLTLVL